jgi:hypothetical protein
MPNFKGLVEIQTGAGDPTILLDGDTGDVTVGGGGQAGNLGVGDASGAQRVAIAGDVGTLTISSAAGPPVLRFDSASAALYVGASGNEGDIILLDSSGRQVFRVDGASAAVYVGANGNEGDVIVLDSGGRQVFHVDGQNAALYVGASGNEGDVIVLDGSGREVFHVDSSFAAVYVGADGNEGDVIVRNDAGDETIRLNGGGGDIILTNADAAEDFEVAETVQASPGTVMVIQEDGLLQPCSAEYDRTVVGVVAGAGSYRPGIVLDRRDRPVGRRLPISVLGKAACRADAAYGPIAVGDLLTSSRSVGCAMRASDAQQAFGAVIGKALTPLDEGDGLVELLIGLQ